MKFALALAFVPLSVLTSAKLGFGRKHPHGYGDPYDHDCGNSTTYPGNVTLPGNTTLPIPGNSTLPGNSTAPGNTTLPANTTDPGTPAAGPTDPVTKREVSARAGGWVQNPSGKASFTAYGGCQSACKRMHQFSSWFLLAERDVLLLQRVAKG